ncbi:MAG: Multisubunit Na+/H+ antiporter MnhC subunit [Thermomicrobiales bacterium]|jgi:multicomponent Na+:H+ antiporter subunit C|nr:Multisubunit Na+/H+ antiporter MnhC subunit [Thermomicrobiales bacterium]MDF3039338.1 Multisubunit Na+/H+ antiporter MnhC subunit [Thermomicrobiales bacterium]
MTLVISLAVAVLIGTGSYLLLKHDLVRVVIGILLISNGANLFIMSSGLSRGAAPVYPLPADGEIADPLVQAMTLTAIVITFGVAALLLSLIYRVYVAHATLDTDTLAEAEEAEEIMAEIEADAGDPHDDEEILARESQVA